MDDALYWIKTIKEKKQQSDVMSEILAILGDIVKLQKIILQETKA
ncbi:hypothetical protein [Borrelia persica]|nr:hypothetical protein [Borrelia persica]